MTELDRRGLSYVAIDTAGGSRTVDGRSFFDRFVRSAVRIPSLCAQLNRAIRSGAQVVHVATSGRYGMARDLALLSVARLKNIRTVYHLHHGRVPEVHRRGSIEWWVLRMAMQMASMTVVLDRETEAILIAELGAAKVTRIPNPIDLGSLPASAAQGSRRVVFIGWVVPEKGVETLLEAWSVVRAGIECWTLDIVGPIRPEYRAHLERSYCLEGVEIRGEVDHGEAMRILAESDILVLPSFTEGFPNVVLEAMALKKAVVATSVGAVAEMLAEGRGVLVRPGDSRILGAALVDLVMDPAKRESFGAHARAKVLAEYVVERVVDQYAAIWHRLQ